ncbi:hypothetical protein ABZV67_45275 [Streptomyces sp. NPDC005065]|uniref:hypothetical protein n=1 Tax=unclassified Streptomyces TaxID=2593676 RepID=UPI0033A7BCF6
MDSSCPHGSRRAWTGTLYKGQTFTVESKQGGWAYGFAYGDINRHGWVQDGWFC